MAGVIFPDPSGFENWQDWANEMIKAQLDVGDANAAELADASQNDWTCFRVYLGTEQINVGNNIIEFDSIDFDLRGEFNIETNTLAIDQDGIYEFGGSYRINEGAIDNRYRLQLYVDGSLHSRMGRTQTSTASDPEICGSVLVELVAGNLITLRTNIVGSGTPDLTEGISDTYFWGRKIRERINP